MVRNLKIGWRNILKNKMFSSINIIGLSIGFTVTAMIFLWVVDEINYDKFHENLDNIYSIYEYQDYSDGQELFTPCTPFPLSRKLSNDYDEIITATTFSRLGNFPIKFEDKEYNEGPVIITDNEFLKVFSFNIIDGNPEALKSPDKAIITQEIADILFNGEPALGKTFSVFGNSTFEVGAIIEKPVKNSTIDFKILLPIDFVVNMGWADQDSWGNNWPRTVALASNGFNPDSFEEKITNICKDNGQDATTLHVFPFAKERLYNYSGEKNRIQYIYQFLGIAFIIILIAAINFVNFSVATAEKRKPEVGIRKTLGASKLGITNQFVLEKGIMVFVSLIFSIILVAAFLPMFGRLADKTIELSLLQNKYFIGMLLIVLITTISLSIAYPAFYISRFSPARVIKKQAKSYTGIFNFRSLLVVIQFALSIGLIICSIVISNQLKYVSNYDLGYQKENLIYLDLPGETRTKHEVIIQELDKVLGVVNYTRVDNLPFFGGNSSWGYDWDGKDPERRVLLTLLQVDPNYFATMGTSFEKGKSFADRFKHWESNPELEIDEVVLNQEAIRRMGIENPMENHVIRPEEYTAKIVGVVKDFHFQNLRNNIEPLLIKPLQSPPSNIIIRIKSDDFYTTVNQIKDSWNDLFPQTNCELGFFDERLEMMYTSETRISGLFKSFTFIAIFIACIGLFGLSLYAIELRRKEIGIRKVNGSTRVEIIALLNKDFILRVFVAFVIASPIAFYLMNKWLQNFAYRTSISWWIFVVSGMLAFLIALITVSWQSWTAATKNPVESLRYE